MKLIFILLLFLTANIFSFNSKNYNSLFKTKDRVVVDLKGNWDNTQTGKKQYIPFSTSNNEVMTFVKEIKIDKKLLKSKVWQLYFAGIDSDIEVYINDNFVGRYLGGMTPFYVKIPEKLINEENVKIKLQCIPLDDYTYISKTMGLDIMRYYSGISRDVLFIGTSKVWIHNLFDVNTEYSQNNHILKGSVLVNSGALNSRSDSAKQYSDNMVVRLEAELLYDGLSVAKMQDQNFKIESERSIEKNLRFVVSNPKKWSNEDPNIYELKVSVYKDDKLLDTYSQNVGFKSTKFKDGQLYLNNKKLFIKGIDYVEDFKGKGATLSMKEFEEDIKLIKKLGANLVRFKFHPPHKYMLDLCDTYGLLVLIDLPAYRLPNRIYNTNELKVRLENVSRRFESAYTTNVSLLAWGLGSEIEFINKPKNTYKFQSDNKFYRTYSVNKLNNLGSEDISMVAIYDSYVDYDKIVNLIDKKLNNQNSIILNFGLPVQLNNNNGYLDMLSVQNQANIIRNLFYITEKKQLAGCIINSFNDYLLQNPTLRTNNKNLFLSSTGLVDRNRIARLSYETTLSLFNQEKEPILDAGSQSEQSTMMFIILGLVLLLVFIFLLNRIKRFREYFKRSILSPYNFYADIRDQRLISTTLTLILSIMISVTLGIFLANFLFHFRNYEAEQYLLKLIIPNIDLQKNVFKMIWQPEPFMFIITVTIFLFLFVVSGVLKLFSGVASGKIFFSDTYIITVWSFIPIILILPFAIVSQKLFLLNEGIAISMILLLMGLLLWSIFRMIKATTVVFDLSSWKVYSTVSILLIVLIILPLTLYQIKNSFIDYLIYFSKFYL
jgi:beta-galactosidase